MDTVSIDDTALKSAESALECMRTAILDLDFIISTSDKFHRPILKEMRNELRRMRDKLDGYSAGRWGQDE